MRKSKKKRYKNRERMRKSRMENYYDENDSDQGTSIKNNSDHSGDNEDLSTDIIKILLSDLTIFGAENRAEMAILGADFMK